ncbi:hypothetical protein ACNKHX_26900 [Shigella flexneri]
MLNRTDSLFMGIYMRLIRPGRVGEVSVHWYRAAGCLYLLRWRNFSQSVLGCGTDLKDTTITFALIGYEFVSHCCRCG